MLAPSAAAASFSQTTSSATYSRPAKVPKPQSVPAMTRSWSPTAATASLMPARDHLRVLDEVGRGVEHARDRAACAPAADWPSAPRTRAGGAGWRTRSRARRRWRGRVPAGSSPWRCRRCAGPSLLPQQTCRRTRSRGMPARPLLIAATCSSSCFRNAGSSRWPKKRWRSMARSGLSICSTWPASWMARYSLPRRVGQRHQVGLVTGVVLVDHGRCDDAGRRRGHEGFGEGGAEFFQALGVLADRRAVDVASPREMAAGALVTRAECGKRAAICCM